MSRTMLETVEHLTQRSIAKHFYPLRDVARDDYTITDDVWYLPPEVCTLYGTETWERMDERQRYRLSLHEFVNVCGISIWFENILMRAFLDTLYYRTPEHPRFRYMLIEVAEEAQHNILFGEFMRRSGVPFHGVRLPEHLAGKWVFPWEARASETLLMASVLTGEEVIEGVNRAILNADCEIHPLAREVARIHRLEEARHLAYAKEYIESRFEHINNRKRRFIRLAAPWIVFGMVIQLPRGKIYSELGLGNGPRLFWSAYKNPHHRQFVHTTCGRLEKLYAGVGIINDFHRRRWVRLGLLPPASAETVSA